MSDGLINKYHVSRVDGRDVRPGDKHYRCQYFVLDLTHDPIARFAAHTYAGAVASIKPELAEDLSNKILELAKTEAKPGFGYILDKATIRSIEGNKSNT
jgi:hypothetical protein